MNRIMEKTIDLHGLNRHEANVKINTFIDYWLSNKSLIPRMLTIITGWGRHSPNNIPVIKPHFLQCMKERGIDVFQQNEGCFNIYI